MKYLVVLIGIIGLVSLVSFRQNNEEYSSLITEKDVLAEAQNHDGKKLMEIHCYLCYEQKHLKTKVELRHQW